VKPQVQTLGPPKKKRMKEKTTKNRATLVVLLYHLKYTSIYNRDTATVMFISAIFTIVNI
jgi:hypothetical protein